MSKDQPDWLETSLQKKREKKLHYTLLCFGDSDNLEKYVEAHLKDGWELYGSPFGTDDYGLCQALRKKY